MTVKLVIKWKPETPAPVVAAAKAALPPVQNQRSQPRLPVKYRFSLYGNQPERSMAARGINMSKSGALVEAPQPLAVGSVIYIKAPELGLMGEATVRHCTIKGSKFLIGLHFPNPLTSSVQ